MFFNCFGRLLVRTAVFVFGLPFSQLAKILYGKFVAFCVSVLALGEVAKGVVGQTYQAVLRRLDFAISAKCIVRSSFSGSSENSEV